MPYANNQGVRIHFQVEGAVQPLVLQHGFSHSLESWYERGYVETLRQNYRLILIDARGHGASDKPHTPEAYAPQLTVADTVAVLDHLNLSEVHFFGYSMGGWVGFGMAKYAPKRLHSLIIGGMHPYKRVPESLNRRIQLIRQGPEGLLTAFEQPGLISPVQKTRLLANDMEALIAATLAIRDAPGFEKVLPTMTMPCLVFRIRCFRSRRSASNICLM